MARKPTEEELAYLVGNEELSQKQIDDAILENIKNGTMEYTGNSKDGEPCFRLTKLGEQRAEKMFASARNELAIKKGLQ